MNITCVYGIHNKDTNQYYIGSTKNFIKRKKDHLRELSLNKHHSYLLQNDWNLNKELFSFEILEEITDLNILRKREQWWIDNSNSYYNINKFAESSLGVKRRQETKDKVRVANLGLKHPDWRNKIKSEAQGGENHWTKKKGIFGKSKGKYE